MVHAELVHTPKHVHVQAEVAPRSKTPGTADLTETLSLSVASLVFLGLYVHLQAVSHAPGAEALFQSAEL